MKSIQYREANQSDIPALAQVRATEPGSQQHWAMRISGYINGEHHPQHALRPRILFIATKEDTVIGFIAGHLTRRFECDGELQWINVIPEYRRDGIASELLRLLAAWFIKNKALHICVNAAADNPTAQQFYKHHGAENLDEHWLFWKDISVVLKEQ